MATPLWIAALTLFAAAGLVLWRRQLRGDRHLRGAVAELGLSPDTDPVAALVAEVRASRALAQLSAAATQRYEAALSGAGFGMLMVDRTGEVVFANTEAQKFLGARHGHAVAEARIKDLLDETAVTRSDQSLEVEIYTPSHRYLGLRSVPLFDQDGPVGSALFVEDLSELHRVNAMRRDFVANASHELKTPLGALRVLAETLVGVDDPATRERLTGRLVDEAARMSKLIDDILDLAQLEGAALAVEPILVKDLLNDAYGEVAMLAQEHAIHIDVRLPGEDLAVAGDRTQLTSALSNLLENAIKYTAVGSERPNADVLMTASATKSTVTVEVVDRGIGIPESHQERVFERFYRVDRARSRRTGGTGLGLAIVRHVVINHGGTVEVESKPGLGTTFRMSVPRIEG